MVCAAWCKKGGKAFVESAISDGELGDLAALPVARFYRGDELGGDARTGSRRRSRVSRTGAHPRGSARLRLRSGPLTGRRHGR